MITCIRNRECSAIVVTIAAAIFSALTHVPAIADDQKPAVSLILAKASAETSSQGYLFDCQAVLDNATGKELAVRTNFYSVFDGLEVVVTNADGKVLAQQGYIYHQSPRTSSGRSLTLAQGRTNAGLVFPIVELPSNVKSFKVRLIGTLPGSDYLRILSSETIAVKVNEK